MHRGAWPLTLKTRQQRRLAPIWCVVRSKTSVIVWRRNTSMVYLQMRLGQLLQLITWVMHSGGT